MIATKSTIALLLLIGNIVVIFVGFNLINKERNSYYQFPTNKPMANKISVSNNFANITKTLRKKDDKIQYIFIENQNKTSEKSKTNQSLLSDMITKIRLVGLIVPIEERSSRIAIIEYGMPPRIFRLRQGDFIPQTDWIISSIDEKMIIIKNNSNSSNILLK